MEKLGSRSWSEPDALNNFKNDIAEANLTNSVGDLLQLTRQRNARSFIPEDANSNKNSKYSNTKGSSKNTDANKTSKISIHPQKYNNIQERPPRRIEISYLEEELTEMIKAVVSPSSDDVIYQPHKDKIMLVRNRILCEFDVDESKLGEEPWFDAIVKSECLKESCDEVGLRMSDMLSVSSAELGNVMRKLKHTYSHSFAQMLNGWKELRVKYLDTLSELEENKIHLEELNNRMLEKENDIREKIDSRVAEVKKQFQLERDRDKDQIRQSEFQVEQMSTTLKSLNAIFKTMQSDVDAAKSADTYARCSRLEREVLDLEVKCSQMEKAKKELSEEKEANVLLRKEKAELTSSLHVARTELMRRDSTIGELMERETLRNAEIEKLHRMAAQRAETDEDVNLDPIATSVLCIKCKKSLDDISNIREAILGNSSSAAQKLMCQSFRILLPNNKGRRPYRSNHWLRFCMRSIIICKINEIRSMLPISGEISGFPQFVYAWFEPNTDSLESGKMQSAINQADEDRWGLYYGVKSLAKDNAEAKLFWSLLDETQGEDGLAFYSHCLSVLFCLGGQELWRQFGAYLNFSSYVSIPAHLLTQENLECVPPTIWLDLDSAHTAVKVIMVKALKSQVVDTLSAIEALQTIPGADGRGIAEEGSVEEGKVSESPPPPEEPAKVEIPATHIDVFMWLRVMLQRFQDEQCHRHAAIRLMFDTAAMGALIPVAGGGFAEQHDSDNPQVYFPQFVGVVKTISPNLSSTEIAEMFVLCYCEGNGKVTPSVFLSVAQKKHLFSRAMQLNTLPLFEFWNQSNSKNPGDSSEDKPLIQVASERGISSVELPIFDLSYELKTRSQIGSIVHRKFTLLLPEINQLVRYVPERWKALIFEAKEAVHVALQEYFVKMKSDKRKPSVARAFIGAEVVSAEDSLAVPLKSSERFIDGFIPFIHYHRLLVLVLAVRSFSENSLLPVNFLTDTKKRSRFNSHLVIVSSQRAENLLTKMEEALFSHTVETLGRKKSDQFVESRRNIYARKIQNRFRKFSHIEISIPRCVRNNMRIGFLRGAENAMALKARRVYFEPWFAQALINNIYAFKLGFDLNVHRFGKPVIPLPLCVLSVFSMLFSLNEIAERITQDLCLAVQTYMHGIPRLRMFACFLGMGELEAPMSTLFRSEYAVNNYLELIVLIHVELNQRNNVVTASIDELFRTSEDPALRLDRRDCWLVKSDVLRNAAKRWSSNHLGIKESIYMTAMSRVKGDANDMMDVDEFLWVMMQMWAKAVGTKLRFCEDRAILRASKDGVKKTAMIKRSQASKPNSPEALAEQSRKMAQRLQRTASNGAMDSKIENSSFKGLVFSHLGSVGSLVSEMDEIRGPSLGADNTDESTDMLNCSSTLIQSVARAKYATVKSYFQLLHDCVLWDTSSGPISDIPQEASAPPDTRATRLFRFRIPVLSAVNTVLSVRLVANWWAGNKKPLHDAMDQASNELAIRMRNRSSATNASLSFADLEQSLESSRKQSFAIDQYLVETERFLEPPYQYFEVRNESVISVEKELWTALRIMLASLHQVLSSFNLPLPADAWKSGRKMHIERNSVYLMQVQTSNS